MTPLTKQEAELLAQYRALPQQKQTNFHAYVLSVLYQQLTARQTGANESAEEPQRPAESGARR